MLCPRARHVAPPQYEVGSQREESVVLEGKLSRGAFPQVGDLGKRRVLIQKNPHGDPAQPRSQQVPTGGVNDHIRLLLRSPQLLV